MKIAVLHGNIYYAKVKLIDWRFEKQSFIFFLVNRTYDKINVFVYNLNSFLQIKETGIFCYTNQSFSLIWNENEIANTHIDYHYTKYVVIYYVVKHCNICSILVLHLNVHNILLQSVKNVQDTHHIFLPTSKKLINFV